MNLGCQDLENHYLMNQPISSDIQSSNFLTQRVNIAQSIKKDVLEKEVRLQLIEALQNEKNENQTFATVIDRFVDDILPVITRVNISEQWVKSIICEEMKDIFQYIEMLQMERA